MAILIVYLTIIHLLWGCYALKKNIEIASLSSEQYTTINHAQTFIINIVLFPIAIIFAIFKNK